MDERTYEKLKREVPVLTNGLVDCYQVGKLEYALKYSDGSCVLYDDLYKKWRYINCNNVEDDDYEDFYKKQFGISLKRLMWMKGITQTELSNMTGISNAVLSHYVNGKTCPSLFNADKISKALDCSIEELRYFDWRK